MAPANSNTEDLVRFIAALQGGYAVPGDLSQRLLDEIQRYKCGEVADVSLGMVFGQRGPGKRSLRTINQQQIINLHLSIAYGCTAGHDFSASRKARCQFLEKKIARLEGIWRPEKPRLPQFVAKWEGELYTRLVEILKLEAAGGPKFPRTHEGIYKRLKRYHSW